MKILIDTHILLWWLADSPRLRPVVRHRLADRRSEIFVSVVSLWEIAIKTRVWKLEADVAAILRDIEREGFIRLPISEPHLAVLAGLRASTVIRSIICSSRRPSPRMRTLCRPTR